jgi:hypothetical protein
MKYTKGLEKKNGFNIDKEQVESFIVREVVDFYKEVSTYIPIFYTTQGRKLRVNGEFDSMADAFIYLKALGFYPANLLAPKSIKTEIVFA